MIACAPADEPCEKSERYTHTCDAHREATRDRGAPEWDPIVHGKNAGGYRDKLAGIDIHCGSGLELQAITYADDDWGQYTRRLPTGVRVRYETALKKDGTHLVVFYADLGGHEVRLDLEAWMRFRWPKKQGGRL